MNEQPLERVARTFKPRNPNGIFILGEFAEINDQLRYYHFSGGSGQELRKMCDEAGFSFRDCYHDMVFSIKDHTKFIPSTYCTDWSKKIPFVKPRYQAHVDHIKQAIFESDCNVVAALGDLALFVLTGETSIAKWRGSCLYTSIHGKEIKVIPTYAPSRILKVYDWRHISVYDLTRVGNERTSRAYNIPDYDFHIAPTFDEAAGYLRRAIELCEVSPTLISHDVETIARNISCSGYALNTTEAMCIPFMTREKGRDEETEHNYWTVAEEAKLISLHNKLLTHRNARVIGQNYLYDSQHEAKSHGIYPNVYMDTMLAWHTVFPGEKKSLDMLASLFCDYYVYWKDELKDYNSYPADETQYWNYNCKDVVYTMEIAEKLPELIRSAEQEEQYKFQMSMVKPVFKAMLRGVKIDLEHRKKLSIELHEVAMKLQASILAMTGDYKPEGSKATTYWFNSPQQTASFFYDYLGLKKQISRATKRPTCNDEALANLAKLEPLVAPFVQRMQELRSVNIFRKNFVEAALGNDQRIRCSYNLAGTETFRLASSKDAFGQGANLQTIPSGNEK